MDEVVVDWLQLGMGRDQRQQHMANAHQQRFAQKFEVAILRLFARGLHAEHGAAALRQRLDQALQEFGRRYSRGLDIVQHGSSPVLVSGKVAPSPDWATRWKSRERGTAPRRPMPSARRM